MSRSVRSYRLVSFLTDYGLADGFVASCHGVLASLAPEVRVLDVTHLGPPRDVRHGAAVLAQTVPYLPPAVHLAVVDPGVGTSRRAVVILAGESLLVGPDNGLLLDAAEVLGGASEAYELTDPALRLSRVSPTFHGRDLFAPAAARFALGRMPSSAGPAVPLAALIRLPVPFCQVAAGEAEVEVLTVDIFGNAQLALPAGRLAEIGLRLGVTVRITVGDGPAFSASFAPTFADAASGEPVLFVDSAGLLAVAVNAGSAAQRFGIEPGVRVRLTLLGA